MQKATAQQLKEHNQSLVLRAIYSRKATNRAAIAQESGLTRPTVSQIVGALLEAGLVREEGPGESTGGKPPMLLSFVDDVYHVLALHIGGRQTSGILTDLRGHILARARRPTARSDAESVLSDLCHILEQLMAESVRPVLGVGISTPGIVDPEQGTVRYSSSLNWREMHLKHRLVGHCDPGLPIYIDNDTNLAALGERVFGVGDGVDNMAIVIVGTRGIGAGLIINGQVYHGVGGGAGEIGHTPVTENGPLCECGRRGCVEALATGWALVRRAPEVANRFPNSVLNTLAPDTITFDDLKQAAAQLDPAATALAQEAGRYLGFAVATLIGTMNPQRVVIGGGVSELGEPFFESLNSTVEEHTLALIAQETEILPASLGADVNLLGAVAQVLQGKLGVV